MSVSVKNQIRVLLFIKLSTGTIASGGVFQHEEHNKKVPEAFSFNVVRAGRLTAHSTQHNIVFVREREGCDAASVICHPKFSSSRRQAEQQEVLLPRGTTQQQCQAAGENRRRTRKALASLFSYQYAVYSTGTYSPMGYSMGYSMYGGWIRQVSML
jgi:hypothetical protein